MRFLRPMLLLPSPKGLRLKLPITSAAQNPDYVFLPGVNIRSAPLRKRARSGDCPQGNAVYSFKPGGRLGPGREHSLEGLDQFSISGA